MSEQGQNTQSLGEQYIAEKEAEDKQLEPTDQTQPQPEDRPKKLSAAERISKLEALRDLHLEKSKFHHRRAAHYGKKIGALRRMAADLGVEIV